jgi:nucleotide-binding universal stress UspA family protein
MPAPDTYCRLAVASTFSPRFVQVLAEANRIRERFGCELNLIYVGEKTDEVGAKFRETLAELSLPPDAPIHYEQGDPADSILRALYKHKIDIVVAGALEKAVALHQFLGNVARRLVREAPCSVFLFTHPDREPKPLNKMVFVAVDDSDHTREALQLAYRLASGEKSERLHVVRVITTFDEARAKAADASTAEDPEAELEKFVLSAGATDVPVEARCIRGNTGFAAADFVQSIGADLLVVPDTPASGPELPANLAWITDVSPCNLWVIR